MLNCENCGQNFKIRERSSVSFFLSAVVFDTGTSWLVHLSPGLEVLAQATVLFSWVRSFSFTLLLFTQRYK